MRGLLQFIRRTLRRAEHDALLADAIAYGFVGLLLLVFLIVAVSNGWIYKLQ